MGKVAVAAFAYLKFSYSTLSHTDETGLYANESSVLNPCFLVGLLNTE